MIMLPPLLDLAWLLAGLVLGLIFGLWFAPRFYSLRSRRLELLQSKRGEAELRAALERMREVQVELRDRLTSTINRHNQQVEQMNTIHAAAMAQADEEFRGMQIKLLRVIDAVEKGEAFSPNAFRSTEFEPEPRR
jgi:hypothetical protein